MKTRLVQTCLLAALLALLVVVQAQFNYTTNNGAITITGYTGSGGDVTIPDAINGLPVTSIGYEAFVNCLSLNSITIPDNVISIGDFAFWVCADLTNIVIPDSVTNIGGGAFSECSDLTYVIIGNGVMSIGDGAFSDCPLLNVIIGTSVRTIGDAAFADTSLTSVTIPGSVTSIGNGDLAGFLTVGAFSGCEHLTNVVISDGVTSIGLETFEYCHNLTSITIPDSVTNIGDGAFYDCLGLTSVYFRGNAPTAFSISSFATAYYLPGTTGWDGFSTNTGIPAVPWQPLIQTGGAGFGVRTNQFGFNIAWAGGQTFVVEACTNLANPVWVPVATNTLTGDSSYFSDPQSSNYPARFYRLHSP